MSGKPAEDYEDKYSRPKLREKIKEEIKESDKGGKPGQWSARKSQMLVQEYEKRGGGYRKQKKDTSARSLERWTNEHWQTSEGEAEARGQGKGGSTRRYLPERAWDLLSENERREADRRKRQGEAEGRQYVERTLAAKDAAKRVHEAHDLASLTKRALYDRARELEIQGRSRMNKEQLLDAVRQAERREGRPRNLPVGRESD